MCLLESQRYMSIAIKYFILLVIGFKEHKGHNETCNYGKSMKEYDVWKVCVNLKFIHFVADPGDSFSCRSGPGREHTFASAARERTQGPVSDNEL
ncbi:hypothetical protein XELAEV_18030543mg [Xenopus laevis]|uniref:Uncharacterized protein n=1 Tax=Xenopus laevis TaxID=8355 RepID=A0A974HEW6_XENLA|nr:hypothetical protein XELAEV_18030543mg [Xenopus laevis]